MGSETEGNAENAANERELSHGLSLARKNHALGQSTSSLRALQELTAQRVEQKRVG
jgi:hypothetical protein